MKTDKERESADTKFIVLILNLNNFDFRMLFTTIIALLKFFFILYDINNFS